MFTWYVIQSEMLINSYTKRFNFGGKWSGGRSDQYNRPPIERSPKLAFWGNFGGRDKDIWWESTSVLRLVRFQASLVQI